MTATRRTRVDRTVHALVVSTLDYESDAIVAKLSRKRVTIGNRFRVVEGEAAGKQIAVLRCEPGAGRLHEALDAALFVHRPQWVIAAGFAIGLDPSLRTGQIIVADELSNGSGGLLQVGVQVPVEKSESDNVVIGRLVTVRTLPRTRVQKEQLRAQTDAQASDRAGYVAAAICRRLKIKFLAVRALVDDASQDASAGSLAVFHSSASFRAGGWVGACLHGTRRVTQLMKLRGNAKRHADRLATFLLGLLPKLG